MSNPQLILALISMFLSAISIAVAITVFLSNAQRNIFADKLSILDNKIGELKELISKSATRYEEIREIGNEVKLQHSNLRLFIQRLTAASTEAHDKLDAVLQSNLNEINKKHQDIQSYANLLLMFKELIAKEKFEAEKRFHEFMLSSIEKADVVSAVKWFAKYGGIKDMQIIADILENHPDLNIVNEAREVIKTVFK
jgi:hypothetical protein